MDYFICKYKSNGTFSSYPTGCFGKNFWEKFPLYKGTIVEENFKKAVNNNKSQQFEIQGIYTSDYYEAKVFPTKQGISVLFSVITNQK